MAKGGKGSKGSNVMIIGSDGNIAVGTSKGKVSMVPKNKTSKLVLLAKQRQELGKKLSDELENAGIDVTGSSHTHVIYPAGEPTSSKKK